jgi:hypothetical protein
VRASTFCVPLVLERHVDHHDGVLLDDTDQQDDADQRDQAEFGAKQQQRQHRADSGRWQRRQDGDRMHVALVQDPEHDIDRHDGGGDQPGLVGKRLLEHARSAGEAAVHRDRHVDLLHGALDGARLRC